MTQEESAQEESARAMASCGWHVFPVDHPELPTCAGMRTREHNPDTCTDRGKHNVIKYTVGADTNPKMIAMWWAGNPRNVGVFMGKSGLIVIDEDRPDGFAEYAAAHGVEIPDTFRVKTSKGRHYYFQDTEQGALGNAQGALREYGIDVRSGNAYVVGPGSMHASGATYTVEDDHEPAPLPAWVVQAIKAKTNSNKTVDADGVVWETVDISDRFELPEVIKDHTRDDTLFKYAASLLARELPRSEAETLMRSAWERCEQPPKARDTYTLKKALAKLDRYKPGRSEGYEKTANSEATDTGKKPAKKKKKTKKKSGKPAKSASTLLVDMALQRYNLGSTEGGQPFAVRPGGHVVRMLRGGKNSLRAELSQAYYRLHGKAAPQQALADALLALEGQAQDDDPTPVHIRVASADGAVWLDLGDAAETVVKIDADGWRIVNTAPVLFQRTALTGVMPEPQQGGDLGLLWEQLNVAVEDRPLVLAWLVAAIATPDVAHAVLSIFGEQGTGKSTASRRIVELIDPSPVPLRKPPRDAESWVTAAQGSWVVGLDNLSHLPDWLSDSICRASTGEGDVRRQLYTDGGLAVFAFRRCVVLNGIDVGALRGDLADRTLHVDLDRISTDLRKDEEELAARWQETYPLIVGALFADVADVIGTLPSLRLASKPRMADFARVLAALDKLHGTDGLRRFDEQARAMAEDSLSADPFLARMDEAEIDFTGKAADLLAKITPDYDGWRAPKDWPTGPRAVTGLLKRNAPALRKAGWVVENEPDRDHFTIWTLRHPEKARISSPRSPHGPQSADVAEDAENKYGQSQAVLFPGSNVCTVCGEPLTLVEVGQTTHPGCDPS